MRKSERKANAILAEAKSYVASYTSPKSKQEPKQEPKQVKNAKIVKLSKGHFFVIAELVNGQTVEIPKRFKSVTKASLWISRHNK